MSILAILALHTLKPWLMPTTDSRPRPRKWVALKPDSGLSHPPNIHPTLRMLTSLTTKNIPFDGRATNYIIALC